MNPQHEALKKCPFQVEFAVNHFAPHGLKIESFKNVVLGGLGGSGIGARIVKSLFNAKMPVPVEVISNYHLPHYVNEHSLVILVSYSGNTEETLTMYEEVKEKKCKCLIFTSGGKIQHLAEKDQFHVSIMESGFQPRMALGYSLTFLILTFGELLGINVKDELLAVAAKLKDPAIYKSEAKEIFESIKTRLKNKIVIVADAPMEPIGQRFSQQINENAKHEAFVHPLPEMNHNVIESYYGQLESIFFFLDSMQSERITARFEFLHNLMDVENNKVVHIPMDDFSITSVFGIIYMLDWLSLDIADYRRVDSLNVPNISSLKEFLEQANT